MKRILLVDDDKDVRFVIEHILLAAGYAVASVESAAQARSLLWSRPYDLVLADGRLGDGTGFEIADIGVAQGAKTLILTAYALTFTRGDLERHPYLMKPVRSVELVETVTDLIGSP
jgi:NtrC-family two-component system response regulator AlgB